MPRNDVRARSHAPVNVTRALLARWPLPWPEAEGDKEERGRVLIVGGASEMPGAVILAATAALRAGAGKLQVAVPRCIQLVVGAALPEARVVALDETRSGAVSPRAAALVAKVANEVQAVLVGPGMIGDVAPFVKPLLSRIDAQGPIVVLDAEPLAALADSPRALHRLKGRAILTPHAGEMASMLRMAKADVKREPAALAAHASRELRAVVALKGAKTFVASPEGASYCNRAGNVGLATSGSGDTLAGIVTGLAARGCDPLRAAVWGVHLHARAGDVLAKEIGELGFLARELLDHIPPLMTALQKRRE